MKTHLLGALSALVLSLSGAAHASLVMNVYSGAAGSGVAGVQSAINTQTPTFSSEVSVIDHWDGSGATGNFSNNFAFPGGLTSNFGVNVIGFFNVVTAGTYTFRSYADDGVQLKIDGNVLFTDSGYHPQQYFSGSTYLTAGSHAIDFIYFEWYGGATVELAVKTGNAPYLLLGSAGSLQTSVTAPANDVPEPGTLSLLGVGLLGALAARRRTRATRNI